LHGTNPAGELHFGLGGGGHDLRPLADRLIESGAARPFVLAGPSQTRNAVLPATLWADFDLSAFVDDVARAVEGRASIDRESVVLAGHSGAGCNPTGGLAADYWSDGGPLPLSLVLIDPCLSAELGEAFGRRPPSVPLWLMWQSAVWRRDVDAWAVALAATSQSESRVRIEELGARGTNPHAAILPMAFERAVRELFAAPEERGRAAAPACPDGADTDSDCDGAALGAS
jgi:hypothetical protein